MYKSKFVKVNFVSAPTQYLGSVPIFGNSLKLNNILYYTIRIVQIPGIFPSSLLSLLFNWEMSKIILCGNYGM